MNVFHFHVSLKGTIITGAIFIFARGDKTKYGGLAYGDPLGHYPK